MYASIAALFLAASGVQATAMIAQRAPMSDISARDIVQGWSLQASSAPSGTTSCGGGSYCPSSLHCGTAANSEVAACCSSSGDCRGAVEGSPACADSAWNLWVGYQGNGFCCESGMVGAYDTSKSVAGTCVASGAVGSMHSAVLTSTGTGAAATSASSSASASSSSASSSSSSSSSSSASSASSASSSSASSSSSSASSESTASKSASAAGATTTDASATETKSTASQTSASASATAVKGSGDKVVVGFGMMGAAFLAAAAL